MNPAISMNSEIKMTAASAGLGAGSFSESFSIYSLLEFASLLSLSSIAIWASNLKRFSILINIHFFNEKGERE